MPKIRYRVVLDTNVLISSELSTSEDSPNKEIIQRWKDDQFDVLWTEDILNEYIDKLKYFNVQEVMIKRKDGSTFILKQISAQYSPLDIEGIEVGISREEIVDIQREIRAR